MRVLGALLIIAGLLLAPISAFVLLGSAFVGGKNAVHQHDIAFGNDIREEFRVNGGREHSVVVQVLVDKSGLPRDAAAGVVKLDFDFPLTYRLLDGANVIAEGRDDFATGKPGVSMSRHSTAVPEDAIVTRELGRFRATADGTHALEIRVEPDRLGKITVTGARILVFDDAQPWLALPLAGIASGILMVIAGIALVITASVRKRRPTERIARATPRPW